MDGISLFHHRIGSGKYDPILNDSHSDDPRRSSLFTRTVKLVATKFEIFPSSFGLNFVRKFNFPTKIVSETERKSGKILRCLLSVQDSLHSLQLIGRNVPLENILQSWEWHCGYHKDTGRVDTRILREKSCLKTKTIQCLHYRWWARLTIDSGSTFRNKLVFVQFRSNTCLSPVIQVSSSASSPGSQLCLKNYEISSSTNWSRQVLPFGSSVCFDCFAFTETIFGGKESVSSSVVMANLLDLLFQREIFPQEYYKHKIIDSLFHCGYRFKNARHLSYNRRITSMKLCPQQQL